MSDVARDVRRNGCASRQTVGRPAGGTTTWSPHRRTSRRRGRRPASPRHTGAATQRAPAPGVEGRGAPVEPGVEDGRRAGSACPALTSAKSSVSSTTSRWAAEPPTRTSVGSRSGRGARRPAPTLLLAGGQERVAQRGDDGAHGRRRTTERQWSREPRPGASGHRPRPAPARSAARRTASAGRRSRSASTASSTALDRWRGTLAAAEGLRARGRVPVRGGDPPAPQQRRGVDQGAHAGDDRRRELASSSAAGPPRCRPAPARAGPRARRSAPGGWPSARSRPPSGRARPGRPRAGRSRRARGSGRAPRGPRRARRTARSRPAGRPRRSGPGPGG